MLAVQNKKKSEYLQNQLVLLPSPPEASNGASAAPSGGKKVNILLQVPVYSTVYVQYRVL